MRFINPSSFIPKVSGLFNHSWVYLLTGNVLFCVSLFLYLSADFPSPDLHAARILTSDKSLSIVNACLCCFSFYNKLPSCIVLYAMFACLLLPFLLISSLISLSSSSLCPVSLLLLYSASFQQNSSFL